MSVENRDALQLEADKFYWAVLESSRPRWHLSLGRQRTQLGYQFEEVLPVPIEDIHVVYFQLLNNGVLACGMDLQALRRLTTSELLSVRPSCLPEFIRARLGSEAIDLDELNLLTGPFLPRPLHRIRRRTRGIVMAALVIGALLIFAGLERRVSWHDHRIRSAQERTAQIYTQVLGSASSTSQPAAARMASELRGLRQTRATKPTVTASRDVVDSLGSLLTAWPRSAHVRGEALIITGSSMNLTASVPSHEQAQSLASAIGTLPGWTSEQPQVTTQRDGVRVSVRYQPASNPSPESDP